MKKLVKKTSSTSRTKTTTPVKKYAPGGSTKKRAVPDCPSGQFWNGTKCVSSKSEKLPKPTFIDKFSNEVVPTYDKKTGKREFMYANDLFDKKRSGLKADYNEVQKQYPQKKKGGTVKTKKK
jgi:hypothetical protein